jgi:D-aspartate ligase
MSDSSGVRERTVVVLNMHYTGLGVARALAKAPVRVIGTGAHRSFFGNVTRHAEYRASPDTANEPAATIEYLTTLAKSLGGRPLIVPTRDQDVEFLMRHRAAIDAHFEFIAPSNEILARILDKDALYQVADRIGVPHPMSFTVKTMDEMLALRDRMVYPCIVKPATASSWRRDDVWQLVGRTKAKVLQSWDEVLAFYRLIVDVAPEVQVQEFVAGGDDTLVVFGSYRSPRDRKIRFFTGRKLLQYPSGVGSGIAVECAPNPEIVDFSKRLLEALDYVGMSEIEYKWDAKSATYKLVEINPRHWDQHSVGLRCNANLTRALVDDLWLGGAGEIRQSARPAVWIAEDRYLRGLWDSMHARNTDWRMHRRIWRAAWVPAILSFTDPRPFVSLLRTLASELRAR